MNGPQHYAEAERLIALANSEGSINMEVSTGERKSDVIGLAQVHATLAQTAAGLDAASKDLHPNAFLAWKAVLR